MISCRSRSTVVKALSYKKKPSPSDIFLGQILTSLEDGVITVDPHGRIVFFNEAAETLTEISAAKARQIH